MLTLTLTMLAAGAFLFAGLAGLVAWQPAGPAVLS